MSSIPAVPSVAHPVTSLRILIEDAGVVRKLVRISWSNRDASLYVLPATTSGAGIVATGAIPGGVATTTLSGGVTGSSPKLSLHESGQAHASVTGHRTCAVPSRPLGSAIKGHLATATCMDLDALPLLTAPRHGPPRLDVTIQRTRSDWNAIHMLITTSDTAPSPPSAPLLVTMTRPGLIGPLHVLVSWRLEHQREKQGPGVVVIGGWDRGGTHAASPMPLVYAIGQ